ncbi:interferon-induced protein with tetratricopeptide repeats 5-like [Centroberyx affinis]|uniref:interferon-induced protein with tetratricopeptide repeats 5-like n=1 Tax=Centroberyx affinis TaxID=166261 RepID=UPI003A5C205F
MSGHVEQKQMRGNHTPLWHFDDDRTLLSRLLRLESRFTWDLKREDMDLEGLSTQLQEEIDLGLGHQEHRVEHSYSFLAYIRYLQDRPKEAASLLSQSEDKIRECFGEESERRLIVTYGDLAWLSYHTGDYTQSDTYCRRVEDILYPTGSSSVLLPEVYGEKAWTFLKFSVSYHPKAMDCFRKALELQPDDSEWNASYAIALYRTEPRDTETSLEAEESPVVKQLRRASEINPDDGVLLALLALKLSFQKHQEAKSLMEKALEIGPDNPHVTRYAAIYFRQQGKVDRAIDLLKRALQSSSQSAFIHHQLALCYKKKKSLRRPNCDQEMQQWRRLAIQHLEEAVRLRSPFIHARAKLALLYAEDKDMSRAETLLQEALEMSSERDKSFLPFVHLCYGQFHQYHTKQEDQVITHYTKGLQLTMKTFEGQQCAKELKQIAERRVSTDGGDSEALGLLGLVCRAQGDQRRAVEYYEKALERDPDNDQYLSALCELRMELQ